MAVKKEVRKEPKGDALGDRMKSQYEDRTRFFLPRRTYTILRVDGRAFHTWTRGLDRPYDTHLMQCMDAAAAALCQDIAGSQFAFTQSDEISVLLTDFQKESSQSWFDGNIQKTVSVAASIASTAFNLHLMKLKGSSAEYEIPITKKLPNAVFDARAFSIPDYIEVENYFVWRQGDARRNSVTLLASNYASPKQLHGKSEAERHDIIHAAGDNWAKHPVRFKHGAVTRRSNYEQWGADMGSQPSPESYIVGNWFIDHKTPVFSSARNRDYLRNLIPRHWENDDTTKKAASISA
jgi:tRNA(His) guanylyltransferase